MWAMLWDDLPDDVRREINRLPTVTEQAEVWLTIHRVRQLSASFDEQCRIFDVVCASTDNAIHELARYLQEADDRDFTEVIEGF